MLSHPQCCSVQYKEDNIGLKDATSSILNYLFSARAREIIHHIRLDKSIDFRRGELDESILNLRRKSQLFRKRNSQQNLLTDTARDVLASTNN